MSAENKINGKKRRRTERAPIEELRLATQLHQRTKVLVKMKGRAELVNITDLCPQELEELLNSENKLNIYVEDPENAFDQQKQSGYGKKYRGNHRSHTSGWGQLRRVAPLYNNKRQSGDLP